MFLSISEIADIFIMTLVLGFVFKDFFRPVSPDHNLVRYYSLQKGFDYHGFLFAIAVTAPAIILHEFGHKFTAIFFGMNAVFHAAYFFLGVAVVLKLIGSPFIFFVPAYVSIPQTATPFQNTLIAFAGPFVNLLLWAFAKLMLKQKLKPKTRQIFWLTARINMFLFIFNMLPLPGFDGHHVFSSLFKVIF